MKCYYAVRFKDQPRAVRIEKSEDPLGAFITAFGCSPITSRNDRQAEYQNLGSRWNDIRGSEKRAKLLKDRTRWIDFPPGDTA